jgi:hypothetical protein
MAKIKLLPQLRNGQEWIQITPEGFVENLSGIVKSVPGGGWDKEIGWRIPSTRRSRELLLNQLRFNGISCREENGSAEKVGEKNMSRPTRNLISELNY